jgi:NmrA-like family
VDYNSVESITTALKGQDAVISCLSSTVLYLENNLVEGAAAAHVKRFIPGHYSADMRNEKSRHLAIMKSTIALQEKLIDIAQKANGMTYTFVFTGGFLEMCLGDGFIANVKAAKATLKDGGDRLACFTRIGTIAKGLVAVLQHSENTENRSVFMSEVVLTQNKVIAMAKEIDPSKNWEISHVDTADLEQQAVEASKVPDAPLMSMVGSVFRMYFGGPDYGMFLPPTHLFTYFR